MLVSPAAANLMSKQKMKITIGKESRLVVKTWNVDLVTFNAEFPFEYSFFDQPID